MRIPVSSIALVLFVVSATTTDAPAAPCHRTCEDAPAWKEGAGYRAGDRVLGRRGNLWECRSRSLARFCDDAGREPDIDAAAAQVWKLVQECFVVDVPEVSVTGLAAAPTACASSLVTLSASVVNDSPFGLTVPVAFYHSSPRRLIGVVEVELAGGEGGPEVVRVELPWENPPPGSALVTVVADDDGTGRSTFPEANETDNAASSTLATCPLP